MAEEFDLNELLAPPRTHHYTFAHHTLRSLVFHLRDQMQEMLLGGQANSFLCGMWDRVGQDLDPEDLLPADGLCAYNEFLGPDNVLSIVMLPQARRTTEAHMVGIVFLSPRRRPFYEDPECDVRFFTLEKSFSDDGIERTALCEWQHDGEGVSHLNYGDGPPPVAPAFTSHIIARLDPS